MTPSEDCVRRAREILKCKFCDGAGWTAEHSLSCDGSCKNCPEQAQCKECYQGEICSYGEGFIEKIATALQEAEGKGLVRINEIYCDRETGEKLSFQRIIELEIALTAARERVRVLQEALLKTLKYFDSVLTEGQKEEGK